MTKYVVFDLDGCLSDDRWRRTWLPKNGGSWDDYHRRCESDAPINKTLFHRVVLLSGAEPIFVTGRSDKFWSETTRWIRDELGWDGSVRLTMRPEGNFKPSHKLKVELLAKGYRPDEIMCAYDDHTPNLRAFVEWGIPTAHRLTHEGLVPWEGDSTKRDAARILKDMGETFAVRNAEYSDNWRNVPEVVKALFPDGVDPALITTKQWHLFELILVKLTRYANSNLTHKDSIHDIAIYGALIESILEEDE